MILQLRKQFILLLLVAYWTTSLHGKPYPRHKRRGEVLLRGRRQVRALQMNTSKNDSPMDGKKGDDTSKDGTGKGSDKDGSDDWNQYIETGNSLDAEANEGMDDSDEKGNKQSTSKEPSSSGEPKGSSTASTKEKKTKKASKMNDHIDPESSATGVAKKSITSKQSHTKHGDDDHKNKLSSKVGKVKGSKKTMKTKSDDKLSKKSKSAPNKAKQMKLLKKGKSAKQAAEHSMKGSSGDKKGKGTGDESVMSPSVDEVTATTEPPLVETTDTPPVVEPTDPPTVEPTDPPTVEPTDPSTVEITDAPVVTDPPLITDAPAVTDPPVATTHAPLQVTDAPATETPIVEVTDAPATTDEPTVTDPPVVTTDAPLEVTDAPSTETPIATDPPIEMTDVPLEVTGAPVTDAPVTTDPPLETTDAPLEITDAPATDAPAITDAPVVTVAPTEGVDVDLPVETTAPTEAATEAISEELTQIDIVTRDPEALTPTVAPSSVEMDDDFFLVPNDICVDAIELEIGDTIFGTTQFATGNESVETCDGSVASLIPEANDDFSIQQLGVWYAVEASDTRLRASVCSETSNALAPKVVSIYAGGDNCSGLACAPVYNTASCSVEWMASSDYEMYYILVQTLVVEGTPLDVETDLEFELRLSEAVAPRNDICEESIVLEYGDTIAGQTLSASAKDISSACALELQPPSSNVLIPAVWYSVIGNGNSLIASTCNESTESGPILVTIYSGACGSLVCETLGVSDAGPCSSGIISTVEGQVYYIVVEKVLRGNDAGIFELAVSD